MTSQGKEDIKIKIGVQYLKDLSIENVNAPGIFTLENSSPPSIDVNYDISVARLNTNKESNISSYEVTLHVNIKSIVKDKESKEHTLFILEAKYAGVFSIEGKVDDDKEKRLLFIYAPNTLFPFLRRIIATSTGDCSFPPLMVDPIDFAGQFEKQNKKQ
ncbi:MAG: protein-export chaperone SecB [Rickettsiaceae bacterium H1]|nr:protein-export chaperone SecB [Rickettsiaceae bacterium H1]